MNNKKYDNYAIIGFVLSFFFSIIGLIFSIIGVRKSFNNKIFAIIGIIISIIKILFIIFILFLYIYYNNRINDATSKINYSPYCNEAYNCQYYDEDIYRCEYNEMKIFCGKESVGR